MAFSLAHRIYSSNHLSNYFSQAFSKCLLAFDYDVADLAYKFTMFPSIDIFELMVNFLCENTICVAIRIISFSSLSK